MNKIVTLFHILFVAVVGFTAVGCGSKNRPSYAVTPIQPDIAAPQSESQPVAVHDPFQATGGRLFQPDNEAEPWAPPGRWREITPGRIKLWVPHFLRGYPHLEDGAIQEILTVVPDADVRIPNNWLGVDPDPVGYLPVLVIIMDPGSYSLATTLNADSAITVAGHWQVQSWIDGGGKLHEWDVLYVAWRFRPYREFPLLPALGHEIRHRLTRDTLAGH